MTFAPILVHYFPLPLSYVPTYALQQAILEWQLSQRRISRTLQRDVILLLQHRPVYTTGRRQSEDETHADMRRLTTMGADFIRTKRGGQTTYHGPGQLVAYPLLDLGRQNLSIRDYICVLQKAMETRLRDHHGIHNVPSEHTGVFLDANTKIASIGVQVQHRLTMHGLAINVTTEPKPWFDEVVACGLADVKAGSIQDASRHPQYGITVEKEARGLTDVLASLLGRSTENVELTPSDTSKGSLESNPDTQFLLDLIRNIHNETLKLGPWPRSPKRS